MASRDTKQLPPKPYPNFPLFPHQGGSWKKKVDGQQKAFGAWRWPDPVEYEKSWKDALNNYNDWMEARAHGVELATRPELTTIETLIDVYLTTQHERIGKGIEPRTFADRRAVLVAWRDAMGARTTIGQLEAQPDRLVTYLRELENQYGFHRYNTNIKEIKSAIIAAEDPLTGVLGRPFRLRPLLVRKREIARRREKRERETKHGKQRWLPDEIRAFFQFAGQPLRAMIGLGYFAGFGNSDCADLPQAALNFKPHKNLGLADGWAILSWSRTKTEIDRAAVLPATVAASLMEAIDQRPKPAGKGRDHHVFLTPPHPFLKTVKGGVPYVRDVMHMDEDGQLEKTVRVDVVQKEFEKLRDRLSHCPQHGWLCRPIERVGRGTRTDRKADAVARKWSGNGVARYDTCPTCGQACRPMRRLGFYTFRHTATTYAIPAASMEARVLFEGHAIEGVRSNYVEELDTGELIKIAVRLQEKMDEITRNDEPSPGASAGRSRPAPPGTWSLLDFWGRNRGTASLNPFDLRRFFIADVWPMLYSSNAVSTPTWAPLPSRRRLFYWLLASPGPLPVCPGEGRGEDLLLRAGV